MKSLLVVASGYATFIAIGLAMKLLDPLIETRSHFAAVVMVGYFILGSIAVGFVPMWVARRLRVDS